MQYVAPTTVGKRELGTNDVAPRFVWVPVVDEFEPPRSTGGNPRALADVISTWDVHCWGDDYGSTNRLRNLLLSGLRQVCQGANVTFSSGDWAAGDPSWSESGTVVVQRVSLRTPLVELHIPTSPTDTTPDGDVVVTITQVNTDPSGAVAGDGTLTIGEG